MYEIPNVYIVTLPLCVDLAQRTITHSELIRDSPCGWCGKKSMFRTRHYTNLNHTNAIVLASCEEHMKQLRVEMDKIGGTPEAIHIFNIEDGYPED